MKTRALASVLLIVVLLGGCAKNIEVRPGVYMSNDPADFPFPTSGYTVYFVGETHGNHETKSVFQAYLKKLHKKAGLRDVILEEDQAYETEANAYVHGETDELPTGLCLRADILGQIREFNSNLPEGKMVTVHLVDVDSPFPAVYKHLTELYQQLGSAAQSIQFPDFSEFIMWSPEKMYELVEELKNIPTDDPDVSNELQTIYMSIEWFSLGNDMDTGRGPRKSFFPMREEIITQNIQHLVAQLDGKPVLAFFGLFHGMKVVGTPIPPVYQFKSWIQRLVEENISIYSIAIFSTSGKSYWRGESFTYGGDYMEEFQLSDGTSLVSLFDDLPDTKIIYTDLRTENNSTTTLPSYIFLDYPASQVYDGLIIFKEFTPMENVCPQ